METTVKIGGAAGQGIQTVGRLLSLACQRGGLFLLGINDLESRIRGGHNFFQMRLSTEMVDAPARDVHLLVALDMVTCAEHGPVRDLRRALAASTTSPGPGNLGASAVI